MSHASGLPRNASSSGRALASPTRFSALDALAFDESRTRAHVDVRVGVEHELAAAEQRAERRPLTARVHERTERERDELRRPGIAGREERAQSLRRVVDDRARDVLGSVIGGPPGFPPPSAAKKMSSCRHTTPFGSPVVPPV